MPSCVVSATCSLYGKSSSRLSDAGGAAEVVDRDRRVPALGEAQRELLVEAVEAAHVGQHHDAGAARLLGRSGERREAIAVGRLEHEVLVRDRGAADDGDRRQRVGLEAHARILLRAGSRLSAWRCSNRASSARTSSSGGEPGCRSSSTSSARARPRSRPAAASARSSATGRAASCSRASAIDRLVDPGTAFLELGALAAWDVYDGAAPSAGIVTADLARPRDWRHAQPGRPYP